MLFCWRLIHSLTGLYNNFSITRHVIYFSHCRDQIPNEKLLKWERTQRTPQPSHLGCKFGDTEAPLPTSQPGGSTSPLLLRAFQPLHAQEQTQVKKRRDQREIPPPTSSTLRDPYPFPELPISPFSAGCAPVNGSLSLVPYQGRMTAFPSSGNTSCFPSGGYQMTINRNINLQALPLQGRWFRKHNSKCPGDTVLWNVLQYPLDWLKLGFHGPFANRSPSQEKGSRGQV